MELQSILYMAHAATSVSWYSREWLFRVVDGVPNKQAVLLLFMSGFSDGMYMVANLKLIVITKKQHSDN